MLAVLRLVQESILSSAWCGGKSRLEQMVERQQATLRALLSSHMEKMARLKQQDRLYVPVAMATTHRKYRDVAASYKTPSLAF